MAKLEVFCRVEVGHQTIKTKIVRDPSLKFNQTLMFSVEDLDESVRITVLNYDKYSQDGPWRGRTPARFSRILQREGNGADAIAAQERGTWGDAICDDAICAARVVINLSSPA
ncbi:hypothetical protein M427DRAFT_461722 [Gonapodya prolifera JEL478]|uniref:C2 domain-containing protein n=1 Tax=Gonapodya prolifera (strain JEL478) TaxID=1344416 RepID=A0A139A1Y1_GONPJ|nr:hypothetical protein M427DRAFT_461722 [Gonapodya prolifera JEL478]|eukprot:KXS10787.1 hypothetical protein M427DRAFT_461722 [Gonapodya prolifera JEL478]